MENWKDIQGFEGLYQVSDMGRVKSLARRRLGTKNYYQKERILSSVVGTKYMYITLVSNTGIKKQFTIHKLVATMFITKPSGTVCVNHKDGNPHNNHLNNLEWVTYSRNAFHAYENKLTKKLFGEKASGAKLTESQVIEMRLTYRKQFGANKVMAKKYNITVGQVHNIITKKSWVHV